MVERVRHRQLNLHYELTRSLCIEKGDGLSYYNCMAVASARRKFMYFEVGAEGCAHDAQVLNRAKIEEQFPPDCYMLFDNGGPLMRGKILTPYKGW